MAAGVKRKAADALTSRSDESKSRTAQLKRINTLVAGLEDGQTALNNVTHLLDLARDADSEGNLIDPEVCQHARVSLYKVFKRLVSLGRLDKGPEEDTVCAWLRQRYSELQQVLMSGLKRASSAHQLSCIALCLRLLRDDPLAPMGRGTSFSVEPYRRLLTAILREKHLTAYTKQAFRQDYLDKFVDLRYHFHRMVARICDDVREKQDTRAKTVRDNALELLAGIVVLPDKAVEDERRWVTQAEGSEYTLAAQRKALSTAWLAALKFRLTTEQYRSILAVLPKRVLPYMAMPQLLADFYSDAYGAGGVTALLALNGLFLLMQKHRLDYPRFYQQLYALLTEETIHSRYRARYMRALATFLDSEGASASMLAAFIKRLGRLCLTAPPGAIVGSLPLIYNLLKRHPSLMQLIQRTPTEASPANDPYNADEIDPDAAGALASSLWELASLTAHYHPSVATLARLLSEPFTRQPYDLEDFLDHSYATLTDNELKAKGAMRKQVPVNTSAPTSLW
ncbi:Maturation and nuclear export of 40S ribosomal subunits interacting protein [Savitreella phatthalungensis]